MEWQDPGRAAGRRRGAGRTLHLGIRGHRRSLCGVRSCGGRRGFCRRLLGSFCLLFKAHDILVGDFPAEIPLRAALLETLLKKYGAARISHKRAGCGQKDVSGAVLHLNPAPKKSRIAGHTVFSFRRGWSQRQWYGRTPPIENVEKRADASYPQLNGERALRRRG